MKNLGMTERVVRVVLGSALAIWALSLLLGGDVLVLRLASGALIALGLDFVITGIRGYCPLYRRLGWSTARPRVHG